MHIFKTDDMNSICKILYIFTFCLVKPFVKYSKIKMYVYFYMWMILVHYPCSPCVLYIQQPTQHILGGVQRHFNRQLNILVTRFTWTPIGGFYQIRKSTQGPGQKQYGFLLRKGTHIKGSRTFSYWLQNTGCTKLASGENRDHSICYIDEF